MYCGHCDKCEMSARILVHTVYLVYLYFYVLTCVCYLQLIPMTDIQEVSPDFQKLNKSEHCIILHMKNDTKIAITSPVCMSLHR